MKGLSNDAKHWVDSSGLSWELSDLSDTHLDNAIKLSRQKVTDHKRAHWFLEKEKDRRAEEAKKVAWERRQSKCHCCCACHKQSSYLG